MLQVIAVVNTVHATGPEGVERLYNCLTGEEFEPHVLKAALKGHSYAEEPSDETRDARDVSTSLPREGWESRGLHGPRKEGISDPRLESFPSRDSRAGVYHQDLFADGGEGDGCGDGGSGEVVVEALLGQVLSLQERLSERDMEVACLKQQLQDHKHLMEQVGFGRGGVEVWAVKMASCPSLWSQQPSRLNNFR